MKAIFIALIVIIAIACAAPSKVDTGSQFAVWAKKHSKNYGTAVEYHTRYQNFLQTLMRVEKLNSNSTNKVFGLGPFADMTPQEFRAQMLMPSPLKPHATANDVHMASPRGPVPPALDWRTKGAVTPVKDQQQCGSCWAFSVAETTESAYILAGKANASTLRVSEQQIVDCDTSDGGCNGGNPETAWAYIIGAGGLDSEKSYPYTAVDGTCAFKPNNIVASVSQWKYATTQGDETTLVNNLQLKPLSICVDAANWQDYTGGIMTSWDCAWVVELDHCVQLVGYAKNDGDTPYYIVRNSWSAGWGENGYIRLTMNSDTCGLTREATLPFV